MNYRIKSRVKRLLLLFTILSGVSFVSISATVLRRSIGVLAVDKAGRVVQTEISADSISKYRKSGKGGLTILGRPRKAYVTNGISREYIGANFLLPGPGHKPDVLPYTGKGVVIGIIDSGIDPNHITFQDEDGNTRVGRYIFTTSSEESSDGLFHADVYDTPEAIASSAVDSAEGGHGTHTAATAAGSWHGNSYAGVAPGVELVLIGTGEAIYDDEIIYGMRAVSEYALSVGKPAVMSLSLGSGTGPRDGTSPVGLVSREIAERRQIVVFSAGNDGQRNASICRDFSRDTTAVRSIFAKYHKGDNHILLMDAWSRDNRTAEIQLVVTIGNKVVHTGPWITMEDANRYNGHITLLSDSVAGEFMPEWRKYFQGEIFMDMGVYEPNGRFRISLEGEITRKFYTEQKPTVGFAIRSPQGADMRIYSYPHYNVLGNWGIPGFVDGTPAENISDFAASPYVISVGMMNATESVTTLDGVTETLAANNYGGLHEPNRFSSYGTSLAGEVLPLIMAPGTLVVSALYPEAPGMESHYVCDTVINGKRYVWGHDTGTSMSSPMVAGTVALWMEAVPTMHHEQVVDVIAHSSNGSMLSAFPHHSAYGVIDAYEGLKYAINTYGVDGITADNEQKLALRYLDGDSHAGAAIECLLSASVINGVTSFYSMDGRRVGSQNFDGADFTTRLPDAPGIYILQVSASGFSASQKLVVKP